MLQVQRTRTQARLLESAWTERLEQFTAIAVISDTEPHLSFPKAHNFKTHILTYSI